MCAGLLYIIYMCAGLLYIITTRHLKTYGSTRGKASCINQGLEVVKERLMSSSFLVSKEIALSTKRLHRFDAIWSTYYSATWE